MAEGSKSPDQRQALWHDAKSDFQRAVDIYQNPKRSWPLSDQYTREIRELKDSLAPCDAALRNQHEN